MLESAFQKKVLKYLRDRGGYWIKVHVSAYQSQGEPDIIGVYRGYFVAFELKQDKNKTTPLQAHKLELINYNGGIAMEIRDLDTVIRVLDKLDP